MKRAFAIDVLVCPRCSGTRKRIALITEGLVVRMPDTQDSRSDPPISA